MAYPCAPAADGEGRTLFGNPSPLQVFWLVSATRATTLMRQESPHPNETNQNIFGRNVPVP